MKRMTVQVHPSVKQVIRQVQERIGARTESEAILFAMLVLTERYNDLTIGKVDKIRQQVTESHNQLML